MIDETAEEIAEMRTHSSSAVAVKAARALEDLLDDEFPSVEEYVRALERNSSALRRASPSHASLVTTQHEIVDAVGDDDVETVAEAKERTQAAIDAVVERVETGKHEAATAVAEELADGMTLLTHDYSTTVLEAIETAAEGGAYLDVYVTEGRPRYMGRRTARRLAEIDRVTPTLIVDGASGHYMSEVDEVLLGMDCIVDGHLYNRVGTYPLAAVASDADVPVVVAGSSAKLVDEGGFRFENDYRTPTEVLLEPPEGFDVENPAYDATPVDLLDRVVTDAGVRQF
ncbi:translation initiation factor eIF-2B subunit delta [Halarchaeum rubridurum]|uniref:Translation initiation factor eIF-2B subunit delta n=1 Tax=Halarchaeum rubridurum TaxID=489911 RepID=A0A830FWQ1_9EURY|nr:translation initiation factor eIF-2B [Halarchaeum rubridurum]MBP1953659.1 translation initiation factor eIF-2B subunit delta [Halarchaeum rubridurum]GGM53665.1 translation initiation factor eIF-2B subunit delta [Halarchaeum rubridurum]